MVPQIVKEKIQNHNINKATQRLRLSFRHQFGERTSVLIYYIQQFDKSKIRFKLYRTQYISYFDNI